MLFRVGNKIVIYQDFSRGTVSHFNINDFSVPEHLVSIRQHLLRRAKRGDEELEDPERGKKKCATHPNPRTTTSRSSSNQSGTTTMCSINKTSIKFLLIIVVARLLLLPVLLLFRMRGETTTTPSDCSLSVAGAASSSSVDAVGWVIIGE